MRYCLLLLSILFLQSENLFSQACTTIDGMSPNTAIAICGTSTFHPNTIGSCTGPNIPHQFCTDVVTSSNSAWYKFHCYQTGTLGFLIIGNSSADDYDWEVMDITGHNPSDVYTDASLQVALNTYGTATTSPPAPYPNSPTGCSPLGTATFNCSGDTPPNSPFNLMPTIFVGHDYLIMVTNWSNSGIGYNLTFGGGTGSTSVITDPLAPAISSVTAVNCSQIDVVFNKDMRCSSVTNAGSEFTILPNNPTISSITANCAVTTNTITGLSINTVNPLPAGNYQLVINNGSDANTFLDVCGANITAGTIINFTVPKPNANFTTSSIENCLGIATTFTSTSNPLTGNTVAQWHWDFGDGTISTLQNPTYTFPTAGIFIVKHWIVNDKGCFSDTAQQTITIYPLPVNDFSFMAPPTCQLSNIQFTDASTIAVPSNLTSWAWNFGDGNTSTSQNPTHVFLTAGTFSTTLTTTSNKGCTSTPKVLPIIIADRPVSNFIEPQVCLNDTYAQFTQNSTIAVGSISSYHWNFGDSVSGLNNTSILPNPQHAYTAVGSYNVQLIVASALGCSDTIVKPIFVNGSFPVANFSVDNMANLCSNQPVKITNLSTVFPGNITKVEIYWDNVNAPTIFDTDNSPTLNEVYTHSYTNFQSPLTKIFTIRFLAYSGGVCVNEKLVNITVHASPLIQFTAIPNTCYDAAPYLLTQGSEIGGVPGIGVYSGAGVSATGLFTPTLAGIGTHTITYTYSATVASCVETLTQTITVLDTASAKFNFATPICDGQSVLFDATSSTNPSNAPAGGITGWQWNFGDPSTGILNTSTTQQANHIFSGASTYAVSLQVTTSNGCKSTILQKQVIINPVPQPSFITDKLIYCPFDVTLFTNTTPVLPDGNTMHYIWNFGDPNTGLSNSSSSINTSHSYSTQGTYNVALTAISDVVGCTNTWQNNIIVQPQPKANFSSDKDHICLNDIVTFTDVSDPKNGTTINRFWNLGDSSYESSNVFAHQYSAAKIYNVSLYIVNSNGCNSDTLIKPFQVFANPTVNAGPDRTTLDGIATITLMATATGNNLQYLWTPNLYLSNPNILQPRVSNMQNDVNYKLTVTAAGGCTQSDEVFVKVLREPKIPNTFSPNNDGVNDTWVIQYLDQYPNSFVQVFSRTGQLVYSNKGHYKAWTGTYKNKPLPFDTYYYIIEIGNNRTPVTGYVTIIK